MLALLEKYRKLLGFVTFGGLAGLVYAVILVMSVDILGIPTFIGSIIAFALAIPVSYLGNRWVTYRSNNVLASEAARFIVVQVINLVLTSAVVHFVMERFALPTYVGIAVAFLAAPIISFILFEMWVYRQRQDTKELHTVSSESSSRR
jgi:putative flippase GtrA